MNARTMMAAVCLVTGAATPAFALDLNGYMDQVVRRHRGLEALRMLREAAEDKRQAGDLDLSPVLNLRGSYLADKKQPNQLGATETQSSGYSASLSKKFATGTVVGLSASTVGVDNLGLTPTSPYAAYAKYGQGALGLSLSQSLWKDGFGRSTQLRRERESATALAEAGGYDLQSRIVLANAESAFWDYLYAEEELKIRKASLDRAIKIENWMKRRLSDGISDRADMLTAQALVVTRRLQLANAEDSLVSLSEKIRDFLELGSSDPLPPFRGDLTKDRSVASLVGVTGNERVVLLESYLSGLQARATEAGAREAEDKLSADLVLSGRYATNSYAANGTVADATKDITKSDTPTAEVALTWTYIFDTDAKNASTAAARKQATAAKLQAERKALESETSWSEMQRRHSELDRMIRSAVEIRRVQMERAKAQADKLARGRTVTSDVVNSEQDAAEAELQLSKLQAEQRKLEAQTRLYVTVKE